MTFEAEALHTAAGTLPRAIAVKAMEEQLASASGRSEHETFSLDEAMNHTRRHTANA